MRLSRFFINESLSPGQDLALPAYLVNYIVNVLRLKTGMELIFFNGKEVQGKSGEYTAILTQVSKRHCHVLIKQFVEKDLESPISTHLFQGISRSERMDYTIQKAVELGINHITPVFTQRSNLKKLTEKQLEKKMSHWQAVANSACEQSGRTRLITVNMPVTLNQMADLNSELNLLLSPTAPTAIMELKATAAHSINIFIGPEGGLSKDEIDYAKNNGYHEINLGKRILRTETAGLVILTLVQFLWGDLNI